MANAIIYGNNSKHLEITPFYILDSINNGYNLLTINAPIGNDTSLTCNIQWNK